MPVRVVDGPLSNDWHDVGTVQSQTRAHFVDSV